MEELLNHLLSADELEKNLKEVEQCYENARDELADWHSRKKETLRDMLDAANKEAPWDLQKLQELYQDCSTAIVSCEQKVERWSRRYDSAHQLWIDQWAKEEAESNPRRIKHFGKCDCNNCNYCLL